MHSLKSLLIAALTAIPLAAATQTLPAKPIKMIVPFGAGTVTDSAARLVADHITKATGQPVIVDNRAGANGILGADAAAKSTPDGYTVLVGTQTTQAANPSLFKALPYSPAQDFIPVGPISRGALVLVASPSFPANNVTELIALAKKNPGKYTFGHSSSSARAGGELFKMLAHVDLRDVPYKSAPQVLTDMLGGHVDLTWSDGFTALTQVKTGKLKALGTTGATRMPAAGVPTIAEQGVAGYELYGWTGLWVPAKTPPDVVNRYAEWVQAAVKANTAAFASQGLEPFTMSPKEFASFQAAEIEKWARIVKAAGITPE
jgi:tripartite-type tricarboxylate transporter receptor subunit TctC